MEEKTRGAADRSRKIKEGTQRGRSHRRGSSVQPNLPQEKKRGRGGEDFPKKTALTQNRPKPHCRNICRFTQKRENLAGRNQESYLRGGWSGGELGKGCLLWGRKKGARRMNYENRNL